MRRSSRRQAVRAGPQISKVKLSNQHFGEGPTMTRQELTPTDTILVAIDVSKVRNDVLIEMPGKTRRRRLVVPSTKVEHDRFVDMLLGIGKPIVAGFEATGNYHRPLAFRLLEAGVALRLVSSVALARTREALHNGWDKNDPKDAQVILHMLRIGATQIYADPLVTGINDILALPFENAALVPISYELSVPGAIVERGATVRGREFVELDVKDPAQAAQLAELIRYSDVLIEGLRPGVMERLASASVRKACWP